MTVHFEDIYELTPLQQGMLFHQLYAPQTDVYHVQLAFGLTGTLDPERFCAAWRELVQRYAVLRTALVWEDLEQPFQVVHPQVDWTPVVEDWRARPDRDAQLATRLVEERRRPFDLHAPPLQRVLLLRLGERDWRLIWTFHHLMLEGWSAAVLHQELGVIYTALERGQTPQLPPVRPYRDYIQWLGRQDLAGAEAYWRAQLQGVTGPTRLPIDRVRDSGPAHVAHCAERQTTLPPALTAALRQQARAAKLTLHTLFQGAWALLLSRYSGEPDVLFGTVVAGRPADLPGAERMVGLFINTLPARVAVPPDRPLGTWLADLQQQQAHTRHYEFSPLPQIHRWTGLPAGQPLLETLLVFENWLGDFSDREWIPGVRMRGMRATEGTDLPLMLVVGVGEQETMLTLRYDVERFEERDIIRMLGHLETLLSNAAHDFAQPAASLGILTPAEQQQILHDWNATAREYPRESTFVQAFEQRVASCAQSTAIKFEEQALSYCELNGRANQLARYLRQVGVERGTRVGIALERGFDMVIAVLAVMKAGGAYVPLDPAYPPARLEFIARDAALKLLITESRLQERFAMAGAACVYVDREAANIAPQSEADLSDGPHPDDVAYVMYTSGSTGKPKGVQVEHRALMNFLHAMSDAPGCTADDRLLAVTTLSFDIAGLELYVPLLVGATVVLASRAVAADATQLATLIRTSGATMLQATPTTWSMLVQTGWRGAAGLQALCGGEALSRELADDVLARVGKLWNLYGPTETTIWSTIAQVTRGTDAPPIGRPIANTTVYVLDYHGQPAPVEVPGELYIGGDGLARGYLGQPELTAERFVPHPIIANERVYRTGDLVRWRADGVLEYLGRRDQQVKIRGHRIELGEIEAVLAEHAGVQQAVVVAREDVPGDKRLVAYVVAEPGMALEVPALREWTGTHLPQPLQPAAYVSLPALPLTPNGKIDRQSLPAPEGTRQVRAPYAPPADDLQTQLAEIWANVLHVQQVGIHDSFFDLGGHSLLLIRLQSQLKATLQRDVPITDLFAYPTVASLARRLGGQAELRPVRSEAAARAARRGESAAQERAIAIIGLAGRFPGAPDVETFWQNLRNGVESITFFTDDELRAAGVPDEPLRNPNYVKARGVLANLEQFDAGFFGFTHREAELTDPQQRLFLECAWEALERAGCDPHRAPGLIGVYAGGSQNTYIAQLRARPDLLEELGPMQLLIDTDKDHLPTRVSYRLNLRGPSVNVQTACSTSLVAVHLACQALLNHECDIALAGGVSVTVPVITGYLYQEGSIVSPDGHCRAFDAAAAGTVSGQGVGVVVLKRLAEAVADGDTIHAVIRGTAINNDGADKIGYTAPSSAGQAAVIALAQAAAGIEPDAIQYIETHGTGTKLGDPIEIAALKQVFGDGSARSAPCALGALKTNIGHLDAAAGVAALIKTALSLRQRELPPTLHFERPNPETGLAGSAFQVNTRLARWPGGGAVRRAGVSSFGLGGTNAHAILEEAPPRAPSGPARSAHVLLLAARTDTALESLTAHLATWLRAHPEANIADVAYTLQTGRREFAHRRAVLCTSLAEAIDGLEGQRADRVTSDRAPAMSPRVAFLFPGQGTQHPGMLRELFASEPVYRDHVERCLEILALRGAADLVRKVLFPPTTNLADAQQLSLRPHAAQLSLFVVEYALAQLWMNWGIQPAAMLGHSLGEYVAACLAGVLTLDDALRIVDLRGRLVEQAPAGAMLAVLAEESQVRPYVNGDLGLAAVNAPQLCVVAGRPERIAQLERELRDRRIGSQRLAVGGGFHSALMDGVIQPLVAAFAGLKTSEPRIPYVSNVTGTWIADTDLTDPGYWGRHLRQTVRFADGVQTLRAAACDVLLEVGPGQTLTGLVRRSLEHARAIPSLAAPREELSEPAGVIRATGQLWVAGVTPRWSSYYAGQRRSRLELPTYPFERQRYWIETRPNGEVPGAAPVPAVGRHADIADYFLVPGWRQTAPPPVAAPVPTGHRILLFGASDGGAARLSERLRQAGCAVTVVTPGASLAIDDEAITLDPGKREHYFEMLRGLAKSGREPHCIAYLWSAALEPRAASEVAQSSLDRAFYGLLHLGQALVECNLTSVRALRVVTVGAQRVHGQEQLVPEAALALGPGRVIGQELPHLHARCIDLAPTATEWTPAEVRGLQAEILSDEGETIVAYRQGRRYAQRFDPLRLPPVAEGVRGRLRERGVYLITGGLGGIGRVFAQFLAEMVHARLVLVGRSGLPPREEWDSGAHDPSVLERIAAVRALEAAGAEVHAVSADVTRLPDMQHVVAEARRRCGALHGVIHAAGLAGGGLIALKSREQAARVLAPKVAGTRVLEQVLAGEALDFFLLTSSVTALVGGVGQVDYTAANAYLDTFAAYYHDRTGVHTVAVNWGPWREVGMAVDVEAPDALRARLRAHLRKVGLSNAEGVEALQRLLAAGLEPQVIVTPDRAFVHAGALRPAAQAAPAGPAEAADTAEAELAPAAGRERQLATAYVAPRNELEQLVAETWAQLFGTERIGVHDNFFDLGGHSLLATQLTARLRDALQVELSLDTLFRAPTVAELSEILLRQLLDEPAAAHGPGGEGA